jgi:hypothetical protein
MYESQNHNWKLSMVRRLFNNNARTSKPRPTHRRLNGKNDLGGSDIETFVSKYH